MACLVMQDSFLLGLAGEGSHDSPEDTELMVTLVWVCGYLCGGKEGFMHLRRFIGVPPPSSSGSPETHRKRRILKSHLVPQTAAIYHHCSPYSVHKDSAVPLWATHFNVCVCVCHCAHQNVSLSLTALLALIPRQGGGGVLRAIFSLLISKEI